MLQSAPATGSVGGVVVQAGANFPVPLDGAHVELSGAPGSSISVRTDGQGRFGFANLPPGGYRLRVTRDGYIRQEYAKRAPIVIKPGAPHAPIIFEMQPAPSISGRVLGESGEPIGNIMVSALKAVYDSRGKRTFTALTTTLTDDRGNYRLYWLDPGDYIVSAAFFPPVKTPSSPIQDASRAVYAPTYFPGASDIANAQRLPLRIGDDLAVDFLLVRAQAMSVRGSIVTSRNERVRSTSVTLSLTGDTTGAARYSAKSDNLGNFEIKNVAPGDYIASSESVIDRQRYSTAMHIVLRDRDENNAGMVLSPGVPVTGRIALDTDARIGLSAVRATLTAVDPYLPSFTTRGFQDDGQFAIIGVQRGAYSLDIAGLPEDLYIKEEHSGQTSILADPLNVEWNSPAPVAIILGSDGGRIDGTVTDISGASAHAFAGAQVVLVPGAERRGHPDQYRAVSSDEDGRFEIRGIPAGDYQLFAWENVEERAWLNSEFMMKYFDSGLPVPVAAKSSITVQVPVIPEKK